jgi:RNA polymerase primary sigma factor
MAGPYNEHSPSLSRFFKEISDFEPLSREREGTLASRGDRRARDELVRSNLGFVVTVAKEYRSHGVPFEDLLHEGTLGLLEAARRFDGTKGVKFITYARWWIRKEILRALNEQTSLVTVPDHRKRMLRRIHIERETLERQLGRHLAWEELCAHSSRNTAEVERIRQAEHREVRIDDSEVNGGHGSGLFERLADPRDESAEDRMIRTQLRQRMTQALGLLSRRQRRILSGRFGLDGGRVQTLRELGVQEGISRERTRQIERESLKRLTKLMMRRGHNRSCARAGYGLVS